MNAPGRIQMTSTEPPTRPSNALRVVIAPDSFKGSLEATAVAAAIAEGWAGTRSRDELVLLPQADGGEGTLDAIALTDRRPPPPGGVQLLTDTTAVLCGPAGAARLFGPQKGADQTMCAELDAALGNLAACLSTVAACRPDAPGAGAAGGAAFG